MTALQSTFEAERDKRIQQLTDAGIDPDLAFEVAHAAAMDIVVHKTVKSICGAAMPASVNNS